MDELNLFTGAGGSVYASKILGWRCVGYVENDEVCQKTIKRRIKDGTFDDAPLFSDINGFIDDGYAHAYKGMVDIITASPPCQGFSVAGKKRGHRDPRNKFPETLEAIRIIEPRWFFIENVDRLILDKYFNELLYEIAEIGYDAEWSVVSAADAGAPHLRKRVWILGHPNENGSLASKIDLRLEERIRHFQEGEIKADRSR